MEQEIAQFLLGFVSQELLIMVGVIFVLGLFIKNIPQVKDWTIPLILTVISIAMSTCYLAVIVGMGFTSACIVTGITQGVIIVGLATYGHQVVKQVTEKRKIDKK